MVDHSADLIQLDGSIHQHSYIVDAESDDLNGVLQPQRIPHQYDLIQESENEESEISGNRLGVWYGRFAVHDTKLELYEEVAVVC